MPFPTHDHKILWKIISMVRAPSYAFRDVVSCGVTCLPDAEQLTSSLKWITSLFTTQFAYCVTFPWLKILPSPAQNADLKISLLCSDVTPSTPSHDQIVDHWSLLSMTDDLKVEPIVHHLNNGTMNDDIEITNLMIRLSPDTLRSCLTTHLAALKSL